MDQEKLTQSLEPSHKKIYLIVLFVSVLAGLGTGYYLATTTPASPTSSSEATKEAPKSAAQDSKTFRDWAEGSLKKKPAPKTTEAYTEGTHLLTQANGQDVALTSSVIDLSKYEGKKVKVYGETQKGIKSGWLMDVGKVEEK